MDDASKTLQRQYISSRYTVVENDWPPYQPKHYTTLALVHYKEKYTGKKVISLAKQFASEGKLISKEQENNSTHNSENETRPHSNVNAMKHISELFASSSLAEQSSEMVLIEGAPGIGKTILSKEVAYQWAISNLLQFKKLLFLVFLRNL